MSESVPDRRGSVSTAVEIGSVRLANPVMTASGTAGIADELADYLDLSGLGAVVVKSLAAYEWAGNAAPRLHPAPQAMLNSVGLQGPGVAAWLRDGLPRLRAAGATVVASIWGRSVGEYAEAARLLATAPDEVVAVEVNLSCPNLDGAHSIFAHDPAASAAVVAVAGACERPVWAKLSPNTDQIVEVAGAVVDAGAEALTLINTVIGRLLDPDTLRPVLGNGSGGLSGRAIHPIAVRVVHEVHTALPTIPIVGVGGISSGWDAAEMMIAGARAVQVGTATFADPRAPATVLAELVAWAERRGVPALAELVALA